MAAFVVGRPLVVSAFVHFVLLLWLLRDVGRLPAPASGETEPVAVELTTPTTAEARQTISEAPPTNDEAREGASGAARSMGAPVRGSVAARRPSATRPSRPKQHELDVAPATTSDTAESPAKLVVATANPPADESPARTDAWEPSTVGPEAESVANAVPIAERPPLASTGASTGASAGGATSTGTTGIGSGLGREGNGVGGRRLFPIGGELRARIYGRENEEVVQPSSAAHPPYITDKEATFLRTRDYFPRLPDDDWTESGPYVVVIDICVDEQGHVADASLQSSASRSLDSIVLSAARTWQYRPRIVDGTPRSFCHRVVIRYERW